MLLTVSEVCAQLKIGRTTFYKLVGSGQLRALKSGKKTLVEDDELKRWISLLPAYKARSSSNEVSFEEAREVSDA